MSDQAEIDKAVEVLIADYARQGGRLDLDHVNRVLERRGLSGERSSVVLSELARAGINIEGVEPEELGFTRTRPIPMRRPTRRGGAVDALSQFLDEVGQYKLLTAAEEIRLARRIELGRKALIALGPSLGEEIAPEDGSLGELSRPFRRLEEMVRSGAALGSDPVLVKQALDGRAAMLHLVAANIRLVLTHAKRATGTTKLDVLDLVQEGTLGLVRASEKFDPSKGYKFSTYATWWIRQAITRALADRGHTVRLPVYLRERMIRVSRARRSLVNEFGREPTSKEIAHQLDWELADVEAIQDLAKFEPVSLDRPAVEDGDESLGDLYVDPYGDDPADFVVQQAFAQDVEAVLSTLTERQREVIERRFGIGRGEGETLEQIGEDLGVTRERIRQIEEKAIGLLRRKPKTRNMRDYVGLPTEDVRAAVPDEQEAESNDSV